MKCSKCGYDYPAKETKCPYCGEPNKLGMAWEKEEDETRKETLLTKAKVLHSMPLYVANKIMNIILLLAVVLLVVLFLVFFILGYVDEKHTEHQKRSASVEAAEEIFKTGDNAALDAYLHEYEVYAEDGYEKYTERVDIYDRYSHFIEDVIDLREKSDWESDKTPRAYEVEDILYYAHEILSRSRGCPARRLSDARSRRGNGRAPRRRGRASACRPFHPRRGKRRSVSRRNRHPRSKGPLSAKPRPDRQGSRLPQAVRSRTSARPCGPPETAGRRSYTPWDAACRRLRYTARGRQDRTYSSSRSFSPSVFRS